MREPDATIDAHGSGGSARRYAGTLVSLPPGTLVDRYRLLRRLGGAMGVVYLAHDPKLDRKIAIKLLRSPADMTLKRRSELLLEARATAQLDHPNIIEVLAVGEFDGMIFLAMEYVEGPTVEQWLRRRRSWREVVAVFVAAGRGLAAAHAAGLVHRDFKPSNAIIGGADQRVRILDFGLVVATASTPSTEDGDRDPRIAGTPRYMSPEHYTGLGVHPSSDQFSFCVALYEALYGGHPFGEGNMAERAGRVVGGVVRIPDRHRPVPRRVRRAVMRGLHRDPGDRWPNMNALLAELEASAAVRTRSATGTVIVGVAALLTGASVSGGSTLRADETPSCARGEERIAAVWNDERAERLATALHETAAPNAASVWHEVAGRIDRNVGAWTDAYGRACAATRRDGHDDRELDTTMRCLASELRHLDAVLTRMESADADMVLRIPRVASRLGDPGRCDDPEEASVAIEGSDEAAALLARVTAAVDARDLGLEDEARRTVEAAIADARALGEERMVARGLLVSATIAFAARDDVRGMQELEQAYLAALQSGDDIAAADAASKLVRHSVDRGADEVERWSRAAEASLHRSGARGRIAAVLAFDRGAAAEELGDLDRAEAELVVALEAFRALPGPDHAAEAAIVGSLGIVHLRRNEDRRAAERLEEAVALKREAFGEQHPAQISTLTNLALARSRLGEPEAALAALEDVLALAQAVWGPDSVRVAPVLANYGRALERAERSDDARAAYERAVALFERDLGESIDLAEPLWGLGRLSLAADEPDAALVAFHRARLVVEAHEGALGRNVGKSLAYEADALGALGRTADAARLRERTDDPPDPW